MTGQPVGGDRAVLQQLVADGALRAVFQPIVDFRIRGILGYEALIRGPAGTPLEYPQRLFELARSAGEAAWFEHQCRAVSLRAFAELRLPGRLFLNVTPGILLSSEMMNGETRRLLAELGIAPNRIVLELTENEKIKDVPELKDVLQHYRGRGFHIAIDDLGEGFANLRMWSEVRPEVVKIDRHFIDGIADDRMKYHFVRAMQDLGESCNAVLVAEGIERREDFECLRDMGIACAQGYFIARPSPAPALQVSSEIAALMSARGVSVAPLAGSQGRAPSARDLAKAILPLQADATNDAAFARFESDPSLDVLPVVDGSLAVGLINRYSMIDRFARPFRKELYGRRSCQQFMDPAPLIVDENASVQELAMMLALAPRHYLFDGFVVTAHGAYLGVGSSHDLMAMITEMQLSAARYANPLTQLPGNVPINEHVDRMLTAGTSFVAAYIDIDNFKPYNDTFGYRRGDDVILLLARMIRENVDERRDFVGHIGGDDFFVVFQSDDWEMRCWNLVREFGAGVRELSGAQAEGLGGYMAENRRGEYALQPLPTLSIGAVRIGAGQCESHREVAAAAADAKKQAKKEVKRQLGATVTGHVFVERRQLSLATAGRAPGRLAC